MELLRKRLLAASTEGLTASERLDEVRSVGNRKKGNIGRLRCGINKGHGNTRLGGEQ